MESKTNDDGKDLLPDLNATKVEETPIVDEQEQTASKDGWKPLEKWVEDGGKEDDWKPAKVFNEIGSLKKKLSEAEKDLKKTNKVVTMMKDHHVRVRETAVQEAIKQLKAERIKALDKDEYGKAEQFRDRIDEIEKAAKAQTALPPEIEKEIQEQSQEPPKVFLEFAERNPWYKLGSNDAMTKRADTLGKALHEEDPTMSHADILAQVEKDIKKLFPEKFETPRGGGPNEEGSRGRSESPAAKKSNLSAAEKQMAKNFGMSEADYAKELESYRGH